LVFCLFILLLKGKETDDKNFNEKQFFLPLHSNNFSETICSVILSFVLALKCFKKNYWINE